MITFPPDFPDQKLLKKAVRWSMRHRYHIPSLTDLANRRGLEDLTSVGRAWQSAGLGTMIEVSESGVRSVHFSLNDDAVTAVHQINKQTITGRLGSVNRTEWIAIAALIVSIAALFKPEILALFKPES